MNRLNRALVLFTMIIAVMVIGAQTIQVMDVMAAEGNAAGSQKKSNGKQVAEGEEEAAKEPPAEEPSLAEIVPMASALSGKLTSLENKIAGLPDVSTLEKNYADIVSDSKALSERLNELKKTEQYRFTKLVEIKDAITQERKAFEAADKPLSGTVGQLGDWRDEWTAEKTRWYELQNSLAEKGELDQLRSTFEKANRTIEAAFDLINPRLEEMLKAQENVSAIKAEIDTLAADTDRLIAGKQETALAAVSPLMMSSEYLAQLDIGLWYAVQDGFSTVSWSVRQFLAKHLWTVIAEILLVLVVSITFYRRRGMLSESTRWSFLASRPLATGLFFVSVITMVMYEYQGAPPVWKFMQEIIVGFSFARLVSGLLQAPWKKQVVYGLITALLVTTFLDMISFPRPLFRLYVVLTALLGALMCWRWARASKLAGDRRPYTWLLRLAAFFLVIVVLAELPGKDLLALYLFGSLLDSLATVSVFMLFMYMIRGGVESLLHHSPLHRAAALDADAIGRHIARFVNLAICVLILIPGILMIWGAFAGLEEAMRGFLSLGFDVGSHRVTVGLIFAAAGVLYIAYLSSEIFQKLLVDGVLLRQSVERGVRHAMARLVHYVIVVIGFLLALSILGFEITKITIMLSALGVGIGFGLQGIVNNFVSGLILLFERPVRIGDTIELAGKWAIIKKVGLRATTVQTFDQADVIIPNADLVANQVTNWTLSNRQVRQAIPVGVVYGSDVNLTMETLLKCAHDNPRVIETPPPQVLFLKFGDSSLDFELRVWIRDANDRLDVMSELHQEIDRRFRDLNIEIAFPQQDLHLRSVDESVIAHPIQVANKE